MRFAWIRLDHGVEGEEYEEVIAFRTDATACFLLMWRDQNTVFAQPMPGRQQCFSSVSAALSRLYPIFDTRSKTFAISTFCAASFRGVTLRSDIRQIMRGIS
jgi:hypothetical protein